MIATPRGADPTCQRETPGSHRAPGAASPHTAHLPARIDRATRVPPPAVAAREQAIARSLAHPDWVRTTETTRQQSDAAMRRMCLAGYPIPDFNAYLGSGMSGSAYGTDCDRTTCKITWNGMEPTGLLRADDAGLRGVCAVHGVMPCGLGYGNGLWAIWREAFPAMGAAQIEAHGGPGERVLQQIESLGNGLRHEVYNDTPRAEARQIARHVADAMRRVDPHGRAEGLADGLERGVETGLLLSDWKPDNIALRRDGMLVLADPVVIPLPWGYGRQVPVLQRCRLRTPARECAQVQVEQPI